MLDIKLVFISVWILMSRQQPSLRMNLTFKVLLQQFKTQVTVDSATMMPGGIGVYLFEEKNLFCPKSPAFLQLIEDNNNGNL